MEAQLDLDEKQEFLWNAAMTYHKASPTLSRILMSRYLRSQNVKTDDEDGEHSINSRVQRTICSSCGSVWLPGNHTVKLAAKSKVPKKIGSLLRREAECSWKLNGVEKNLIKSTVNRRSHLVYHCRHCQNSTKIPLKSTNKIVANTPKTNKKVRFPKKKGSQNVLTCSSPQLASNVKDVPELKSHRSDSEKLSFQSTWVKAALGNKNSGSPISRVEKSGKVLANVNVRPASKKPKKNVNKLKSLLRQSDSNNSFKNRLESLLQTVQRN